MADRVRIPSVGLRGRREPRNERRLLSLCVEVAQAYADLHDAGILHGDVHPRNLLVEPDGHVRLIDFGLSRDIRQADESVARGWVAFYLDPESAKAQLDHAQAPLTAAGEQYSVAALLYQLWTGTHYVDWRLERDEMLPQIIQERPAPFATRGISPWPALEETLGRALDKRPARRFESMTALTQALRQLLPETEARDRLANARRTGTAGEQDLLGRSLRRYDIGAEGFVAGPANPPLASINYGAGGIA